MIKATAAAEQCYSYLPVCEVFQCVQTTVWLPVLGIFNMSADADACDCALRLYKYCKRTCTERDKKTPPPPTKSWLWEKNPLLHWRTEPASVLHLAFWSDALPIELSCQEYFMTWQHHQGNSWSSNTHLVVTASTSVHELLLSDQQFFTLVAFALDFC